VIFLGETGEGCTPHTATAPIGSIGEMAQTAATGDAAVVTDKNADPMIPLSCLETLKST